MTSAPTANVWAPMSVDAARRLRFPADDQPKPGFLRWPTAGRQSQCQFRGGAESLYGGTSAELPDRASRCLGLRRCLPTHARLDYARWQAQAAGSRSSSGRGRRDRPSGVPARRFRPTQGHPSASSARCCCRRSAFPAIRRLGAHCRPSISIAGRFLWQAPLGTLEELNPLGLARRLGTPTIGGPLHSGIGGRAPTANWRRLRPRGPASFFFRRAKSIALSARRTT